MERAPTLLSVSSDEQLKVLADRFQRPDGFDLWSDKDGPQLFDKVDRVPSVRFFPKGIGFREQVDLKNSMDEQGNSRKRRIGSTPNSSNVDFNGSQRSSVAQRLEYSDSDCYD